MTKRVGEKIVGGICLALAGVAFIVTFAQALSGETSVLVAQVSENDLKEQKNQIKDRQNYVKELLRELTEIQKESKPIVVDIAKAQTLTNKFSQCVQEKTTLVGTEGFWDSMNDCYDLSREVEIILEDELRPKRDCSIRKNQLEDRKKRERKDRNADIKDILRNDKNTDVSPLNAILAKIDAEFAKADKIVLATCNRDESETLNDIHREIESQFGDFYDLSQELNEKTRQKRGSEDGKKDFQNNIKKGCERDKSREFNSFQKLFEKAKQKGKVNKEQQAGFDTAKATYTTLCVDLIKQMQAALDVGDVDAFDDARANFWNSERDFSDALNETRESLDEEARVVDEQKRQVQELKYVDQDLKNKDRDAKKMKKELVRIKKKYDGAVKKFASGAERKELLQAMANLIKEAESVVTNIEKLIANAKTTASQDPESYWSDYQEELNDLQNEFNELQDTVNRISGIAGELNNAEKGIKLLGKELVQYADVPEIHARLKELLTAGQSNIQQIWASLVSDPEGAEELFRDLQELGSDWGEVIEEYNAKKYGEE